MKKELYKFLLANITVNYHKTFFLNNRIINEIYAQI